MFQPLRSYAPPVFRGTPPCNRFFVDMEGRFTFVRGEALERTGMSEEQWRALTAFDLYAAAPELAGFYTTLFRGSAAEAVCTFAGSVWRVLADPVFVNGSQVGAAGVCWVLEPERGREPDEPSYELWEAAGDNARWHVWSGDRFHVTAGGVVQYRRIPCADFEALRKANPTRVHLLRAAALRAHLRLLTPG